MQPRWLRAPAFAVLALAACTVPTSAPEFNTGWTIPAATSETKVSEMLPDGVTTDQSNLYVRINESGGDITVPVPGSGQVTFSEDIEHSTVVTLDLPPEFRTGSIKSSQQIVVTLSNTLPFDALSPDGVSNAEIRVRMTANGSQVAATTIGGASHALAAGGTLQVPIALQSTSIVGPVVLEASYTIPAGTTVTAPATGAIRVVAQEQQIAFQNAVVVVDARDVSANDHTIEMDGISESIRDRIESGVVRMHFDNPWNATIDATIRLAGEGAVPVTQDDVVIPAGTSAFDVPVAPAAMQELMKHDNIVVRVTGVANGNGAGKTVAIAPGEAMNTKTNLSLNLKVGS